MDIEGVVFKILPPQQGTSARGAWHRQDVVFETNAGGNFTRKVCVKFFNKESEVSALREGEAYTVSIDIDAHEYNGRWYNELSAWRVQPKQPQGASRMAPEMPPIADEPAYGGGAAAPIDDMPF